MLSSSQCCYTWGKHRETLTHLPPRCCCRCCGTCLVSLMCSNKVDLNRNFPDPIELAHNVTAMQQPLHNAQPETLAMMKWIITTR